MVFSSLFFMFIFLPIVLIIYFIAPQKMRNLLLLGASLVFYGWGEPRYIILMIGLIVVNYVLALKLYQDPKKAKAYLVMAIFINLMGLVFFKYYGFMIESLNQAFSLTLQYRTLPLPIGISFYTFQILSYIIDVYLGKIKPQKSLISFSLYVTMFPQLVAGPIVKYTDIEAQLMNRNESLESFGIGAQRFIQGLAKKVLLANNIGLLWTAIQGISIANLSVFNAWIGMIAFTFQIYFDFSGYSDMAIGLGKMFGFEMKENFNYPYVSKSITDFWRRWHVSLGGWFREYVYIPLGGNRKGMKRQVFNLLIVWLLTGLWHGASWNFIIWGLYYGVILWIEKCFLKRWLDQIPTFFRQIYTMVIVIIGWTFFSIESLSEAMAYLGIMFGMGEVVLWDQMTGYYLSTYGLLFIVLILCATPWLSQLGRKLIDYFEGRLYLGALMFQTGLLLLCLAYLVTTTYNPFLYFRF